jgi:hypothetical protein
MYFNKYSFLLDEHDSRFLMKENQMVVILMLFYWQIEIEYNVLFVCLFIWLMVLSATYNNISVVSWRSVLLVEDPEKTTDLSQVIVNKT